jgi:uncharacterized protein (DUF1697 family)
MSETRYLALLRGINVGGRNIIKMTELKASFEAMGMKRVETYIQSGNVVFSCTSKARARLVTRIEKALSEAFSYTSSIVLLTADELAAVVEQAPPGFGKQPTKYRYDVLFMKPALTPSAALQQLSTKAGVDLVFAGSHALYFRRLSSKATQSHLNRVAQLPIYRDMTLRNWNTTRKLLQKVID